MEELSQTVLVVSIVLILLTALAVGIRFWSRFDTVRILGLDDGLVFFSWIASIVVCSSIAAATRYGLGVHHNKVPIPEYETFLKIQIATSVSYSLGVTSAKASFAILYLRLFPVRSLMILNKAVVIFLLCQAIEESLVVPFRCSPIKKSWIPDLEGYCFDLHPLWYTTFAFNLTTDIILFIEPMLIVWRLQMPLVKRIALVVMLSLGVLVTAISVIRLKYVISIGADDTVELVEPFIWSAVEICALIICSCIPSFRQVAAKIPGLNSVLGLSSGRPSGPYKPYSVDQGLSIQLRSRGRKEYVQSQKSKINRSNPFGSTTRTTATALKAIEENQSQEDIFPHRADDSGAIMVTREVFHSIESCEDGASSKLSKAT